MRAKITSGFWAGRQKINAETTIYNVYERFRETGRFAALKQDKSVRPHIFWDSDVAKWIEAAAYILRERPDNKLEGLCDEAIADILASQEENGYFNSYFSVVEPENKFTRRTEHELYCAGHLIEAAVAYHEATGKDAFLTGMRRLADCVYRVFYLEKSAAFTTPGHEEIELALVRLYRATGEKKYLDLATFFVESRGRTGEKTYEGADSRYDQSHLPAREQTTAEGHAVRALYFYCAMADLAAETGDAGLKEACRSLFDNITQRRMYVTGGVGSAYHGEAFTYDYDLKNAESYAETCAAIALMMFIRRLTRLSVGWEAHAVMERVLYNGMLAGVSLDGKGFFYVNPHEVSAREIAHNNSLATPRPAPLLRRVEVFDCSCCPPNLSRVLADLASYACRETEEAVYIDQLMGLTVEGEGAVVTIESGLPFSGKVRALVRGKKPVRMRIPDYCERYDCDRDLTVCEPFYVTLPEGETAFDFGLKPRFVYAGEHVGEDAGRRAVQYGPLILCAEGVDNGTDLRNLVIPSLEKYEISDRNVIFTLTVPGRRLKTDGRLYSFDKPREEEVSVRLVPYFMWANRDPGDLQLWFL